MCTEKHVLLKQFFYKWTKQEFPQWDWVQKRVNWVETHWLSGNKKVPGAVVSKEKLKVSLYEYRVNHYQFLWKKCIYKQWFLLPTLQFQIYLTY